MSSSSNLYEDTNFVNTEFDPKLQPPDGENLDYPVEVLRENMGRCAWEYRQAIVEMRKLEVTKSIREKKTKTILASRRFGLLTNEKLRDHMFEIYKQSPGFKITADLYESFIHLEHQQVFDVYRYYEAVAEQASKEYDMWARMMSWHQSELKHDGIELSTLGTQKG